MIKYDKTNGAKGFLSVCGRVFSTVQDFGSVDETTPSNTQNLILVISVTAVLFPKKLSTNNSET